MITPVASFFNIGSPGQHRISIAAGQRSSVETNTPIHTPLAGIIITLLSFPDQILSHGARAWNRNAY